MSTHEPHRAPSGELTTFSHVILVLVGEGGAAPHDLNRMMRQGRLYWAAAASQYYAEPKRLAKLGYLTATKEPGRTRERTRYELTDRGRDALRAWAVTPVAFPRIQHEPVTRVLAADIAGPAAVLEGLSGLREEIASVAEWLDRAEAVAASIPHRERYLRLNHRLARRLLQAHLDWLDDVERELGHEADGG